jgi:hypothetical protein
MMPSSSKASGTDGSRSLGSALNDARFGNPVKSADHGRLPRLIKIDGAIQLRAGQVLASPNETAGRARPKPGPAGLWADWLRVESIAHFRELDVDPSAVPVRRGWASRWRYACIYNVRTTIYSECIQNGDL